MLRRIEERIERLRQSSESGQSIGTARTGLDAIRIQVTEALAASPLFFDYSAEIERRARRAWNEPLPGRLLESFSARGRSIHIDPEAEEELVIAASNLCTGVSCPSTKAFIREIEDLLLRIAGSSAEWVPAEGIEDALKAKKSFFRSIPCALTFIECVDAVRIISASIDASHLQRPASRR